MPPYLRLLQEEAARAKAADLDGMLTVTLDHMARGGIYDQVGGGFHRYSTERTWTVPHFEKMLYDNAQLVEVYARAYRLTKKPLYRRVVEETLAFVKREMTAPEGGFYSAIDAETDGEEGRFYVWTDEELDAVLKDKADNALVRKVYGADEGYNFDGLQSPPVVRLGDSASASEMFSVPNFYGAHGNNSELPSMSAILSATGPHVKRGKSVKKVRTIDVVPTILDILDVPPSPAVDGEVIPKILKKDKD